MSLESAQQALRDITNFLNEKTRELGDLRSKLAEARLKVLALEKEKTQLQNNVVAPEEVTAWCSDYVTDIASGAEVGTIEVNAERKLPINLFPAYNGATYDINRDGELAKPPSIKPFSWLFDEMIRPGWQKHQPTFRVAVITSISGDLCNVTLDAAFTDTVAGPEKQRLSINPDSLNLSDVPIQYMNCNGAAFQVDDRVIVQFIGQDPAQPTVIGFESNPRTCNTDASFIVHTAIYDDPTGSTNFTVLRQNMAALSGSWSAVNAPNDGFADRYSRSTDGTILSWGDFVNGFGGWLSRNNQLQHPDGESGTTPPIQTKDDYLYQDWKDALLGSNGQIGRGLYGYLYDNGTQILDLEPNSQVACAALIHDSAYPFPTLVVIEYNATLIGSPTPTDFELEINVLVVPFDRLQAPFVRGDFEQIGQYLYSGPYDATPTPWLVRMGVYAGNLKPMTATSDGRRFIALFWDEYDDSEPDYTSGRPYKFKIAVDGRGGGPGQGGTMVASFDRQLVQDPKDFQQWVYNRTLVKEELLVNATWRGLQPSPLSYWLVEWMGDFYATQAGQLTQESGTECEVIIGYGFGPTDQEIEITYAIDNRSLDVTDEVVGAWRAETLTQSEIIGGTALPIEIGHAADKPAELEVPNSVVVVAADSAAQFTTDDYERRNWSFKRNGSTFLSGFWDEHGLYRYFDRQGDVQKSVTDATGSQTVAVDFLKAPTDPACTWPYPIRVDYHNDLFAYVEYKEKDWRLYASASSGQTVPATWEDSEDSIEAALVVVNMATGVEQRRLPLGSVATIPDGLSPPSDSLTVEDWTQSPRYIEFASNWRPDEEGNPGGARVGETVVTQDTRSSPTVSKNLTHTHQMYPNSLLTVGVYTFIDLWSRYAPHCDFAENNGVYFLAGEGLGGNTNPANWTGGPAGDPATVISDLALNDIAADPTLRFTPIVPNEGFPYVAQTPTETPLTGPDELFSLTDDTETDITN